MLKKLYDWTLEKAADKKGERWLAAISFAESSFFPVPIDLMLLPMMLADHGRVWRLALITTLSSVAGAVLGYIIGAFLFEAVAQPLIAFYGYEDKFAAFKNYYIEYGVLIVLAGGLTPIPFKVITIACGVIGLNPLVFFLTCFPARAPRFYIEAALIWRFGRPIQAFIEKRLPLLFTLVMIVGIGGFVVLKYI